MESDGLSFNTPVDALKNYSKNINIGSQNLASTGTIAGRLSENLITASQSQNSTFSLQSTQVHYLDNFAEPISSPQASHFTILGDGFAIVKDSNDVFGYVRDCTFAQNAKNQFENSRGQILQVLKTDQNGLKQSEG